MSNMKRISLLALVVVLFFAGLNNLKAQEKRTKFIIYTTLGDMKGELFNETPMHRDNFIKLVKEGWYTDSFFHRVIKNFMIQGGQNADGREDAGYTVPAEFVPEIHVHHKGALAAARESDNVNPTKASSAAQFYIVQGKIMTLGQLDAIEEKINNERKTTAIENYILFPGNEKWLYKIDALIKAKDMTGLKTSKVEVFKEMLEKGEAPKEFHYSEEQKKIYTTIGGTPHLDGSYVVYGKITEGLDVLDKIAATAVIGSRPIEKVLMKIEIID
ncbi:MAG: peptidylprolyl isomerase [Bacteroidetes bacterium]|nr:MAG: peptidylprolyl isomerase [Bacteroidota bacterium]